MTTNLKGIVILAGGESSRMGSPKALLQLPTGENSNETLLAFHLRHAKLLNVPVMVAENGKNFCQVADSENVKMIDDYLPQDSHGKGAGALSAIANALQAVKDTTGYVLVVSCDCLIGANQLAEKLLAQSSGEDVIYLKGEKDYPLLGLYCTDLLPKLKDFLDKGNRSVMKFLSDKKVKTVNLPNEWVALANFNTKNEFELALAQLDKENS